ncbi:hypothetical protein ABW636_17555 [Aquimarina sp. 2201CG1-2-11]|uniref:hypothetical protein n=1 Tax=Aquimarina discodermiae TaxID=3231043 RepID=UPI0034636A7D
MISTKEITEELKSHPILRHAPGLLDRWKGKEARLFNLTTSHRKIQLKISENRYIDSVPYLLISMLEPIKMNGPFDWDHADLEIQFDGDTYKVIDAKAAFEISCNAVSVAEYK